MGKNHYPGKEVRIVKNFSGNPSLLNYSLADVIGSFNAIHRYGDFIAVHENGLITNEAYTGINNHFQGIQRLRDGQHMVISGGNIKDQHAHLFIAKLSYYGAELKQAKFSIPKSIRTGPLGSNVLIKEQIPATDVLENIICLETGKYWHAGGISLSGDVLAVPLENREDKRSVIAFYNMKNPKKVEQLGNMILRNDGKCGAVALTQLPKGKMLCVAWSDDDDLSARFEFYISTRRNDLRYFKSLGSINYSKVEEKPKGKSKFQSIQIIQQDDGRLYLLATQNTNKFAPKINGTNEALLFAVSLNIKKSEQQKPAPKVEIKFIQKRRFASGKEYFNFAAAAGVYINEKKEMSIYSGYHWRRSKSIRFAEFYERSGSRVQKVTKLEDSRIELFEDKNFKKRRIVIYGDRFSRLKKYDEVFVHGGYFDDNISSIRFLLPEGIRYRLYDDSNFNEGNRAKNYLTLIGSGYEEKIKDLKNKQLKELKFSRDFNDKISSSKYLK